MKISLILLIFLAGSGWSGWIAGATGLQAQQDFDRKTYYHVLKEGKLADVNRELDLVAGITGHDGEAYTGTLLMRKAGLLKVPREKLSAFKSGRIKLETALRADSAKVEYHFLRLIIQEHAPKIVKYRDQVDTDREMIRQHFAKLPADLQEAINDYRQG